MIAKTVEEGLKYYNRDFWYFLNDYKQKNPHGHYFDAETLRCFGERLSDMRILKRTVEKEDCFGNMHTCFVLSKLSKDFLTGKKFRNYAYFDVETMTDIS